MKDFSMRPKYLDILRSGIAAELTKQQQDPDFPRLRLPVDQTTINRLANFGSRATPMQFGTGLGTAFLTRPLTAQQYSALENFPPINDGIKNAYTIYIDKTITDINGEFRGPFLEEGVALSSAGFAASIPLLTGWQPGQAIRVLAHRSGVGPYIDQVSAYLEVPNSGIMGAVDIHPRSKFWGSGEKTSKVIVRQPKGVKQPWRVAYPDPAGSHTRHGQ